MKYETDSGELSEMSNTCEVAVNRSEDITPPGNITDLAVDIVNNMLEINFTCPGDDGFGADPVAKISIRYAAHQDNVAADNFHNDSMNREVRDDDLVSGSLALPHAGNTTVILKLNASAILDTTGRKYFFAVKTADDTFNWSGLSNIRNVTRNSESMATVNILHYTLFMLGFFISSTL